MITTTREARCMADLDQDWSIVARKVDQLGTAHPERWGNVQTFHVVWDWCGDFGGRVEGARFRKARFLGTISTVQGRGDNGLSVLYARLTPKYTRGLKKSDTKCLRTVRAVAIA